jgi:uncharacterized LabA/DUF88 family protein
MASEPREKRAIVFVDGQNLFHAAREAFGYRYPNYHVARLARALCSSQGWLLTRTLFYTGVPASSDDPFWYGFWAHKLAALGRQGVVVNWRLLRYRNQTVRLPDGSEHTFLTGEEKGIDVRIALDVIRMAHRREYDVALILSHDQDLSEAADEIRVIAREQQRWIKVASAFPDSPTHRNRRGIDKTDWIRIDRTTYDACIDRRDYRPKLP